MIRQAGPAFRALWLALAVLLALVLLPHAAAQAAPPSAPHERGAVIESRARAIVQDPAGLHARPAARLAALAKTFAADVRVKARGGSTNSKSPSGLLRLGARCGERC